MNKLLQLFKQNQARKPAPVRAAAEDDKLYVYDVIGGDWYGGVSAKDFIADLQAIQADTVHLHINSPGGDVFEARAMCQAIGSASRRQASVVARLMPSVRQTTGKPLARAWARPVSSKAAKRSASRSRALSALSRSDKLTPAVATSLARRVGNSNAVRSNGSSPTVRRTGTLVLNGLETLSTESSSPPFSL